MKILDALNFYLPHWTGLTAIAKSVAEGHAERGHEVTVLTSRPDRLLLCEEVIAGVKVVRLPIAGRLSRAEGSALNPINFAVGMLRAVDRLDDDQPAQGELSCVSLLARLHKPATNAQ